MKTVKTEIHPRIEFPQQGETIISPHYTFRVSAPAGAERVDVSINHGHWLPCRNGAGYWWHDWSGYADGQHDIIARSRRHDGRWLISAPIKFLVATTA